MKIPQIVKVAAVPALLLLAACGQEAAVADEAAADAAEMSVTGATTNRDWMPAGIVLPEPHTVLQDTKIGQRTYLLQVSVPNDPTSEFAGWKSALEASGYELNEALLAEGQLLFQGGDVESGQIAVLQPEDIDGYMIQIDVSRKQQ